MTLRLKDGKTDNHLAALKTAADSVRIAESLGLRSKGRRFFCFSCQADGGKTPDMSVSRDGYNCFKCGKHGDILTLIQEAGRMDFRSAVALLERETGISPPGIRKEKDTRRDKSHGPIAESATSRRPVKPDFADKTNTSETNPSKTNPSETIAAPDPAVYEAFLAACRPVDGRALDWLVNDKGVRPDVISSMGLRFCGSGYPGIMENLENRLGRDALLSAGLLKPSASGTKKRLVPSFWSYYAKKTGFLVVPYRRDGRTVYLKVRPPVSKAEAERAEVARFMNTGGAIPCLYNIDALKTRPEKILICEGESDTWAALSHGYPAVGSPGALNFKAAWVESFSNVRDKTGRSSVYLVPDADKAGAAGARTIAGMFVAAGLPTPLQIKLPEGKDLSEYLKDGVTE